MTTVDSRGVRAPSLAENKRMQESRFRGVFGTDMAFSDATPQSMIAGIQALGLTEIGEALVTLGMANSVDHADGNHLRALASLLGIEPFPSSRSTVTATVTGVAGTVIPAGSRVRSADGPEFRTVVNAAILSPSGTIDLEAIDIGPVAAAAGSLTEIVTLVTGWETVTNAEAAVPGRAAQSDADFRRSYMARTAMNSGGYMGSLTGALEDIVAGRNRVVENNRATSHATQEFTILPNSIMAIAESGTTSAVERVVENHRGMGVGTTVAIFGGAPDDRLLGMVSGGSIEWDGRQQGGLDLSGAATPEAKAAALTTLLDGQGVVVSYIGSRYVAFFNWMPGENPEFGDVAGSTVATLFGLVEGAADYPLGPFVRTTEQALTVTADVTRRTGFPGDGLALLRQSLVDRVAEYGVGEEVWINDLLCALESVAGSRVTTVTAQHGLADVSGVSPPLNAIWTLPLANITVNLS